MAAPHVSSANPSERPLGIADDNEGQAYSIEERLSQELIIALVGPVGSGVSTTAQIFCERLDREYGYKVEYLKVSPLIKENAHLINEKNK